MTEVKRALARERSFRLPADPLVRENTDWLHGYAAALAALVRLHDRPTIAKDIADCDGLDLGAFEAAGIEPFDLIPLRRAFAS